VKTREDFQNMFEPADAGFEDAVQRALWGIRGRERNAVRRKLSAGLVFAVLLSLLLAAAALAAAFRWGVLDFATGRGGGTKVLPEATKLVQDAGAIPQTGGHLKDADFSVRQAVYDGNQAYVIVEARAKDPDVMLLDGWSDPSSSIANLIPGDENEDATFEEYANARGKTRFLEVSVSPLAEDQWFARGEDARMEEDGTMVFMLQGACREKLPEIPSEVACYVTPLAKQADGSWRRSLNSNTEGLLAFTLKLSDATLDSAICTQPLHFPGPGVRVDKVSFAVKPMAIYYEIGYTVTDLKAFQATEQGLSFEFLDRDGKRIRRGVAYGEVKRVGGGDGFGEEAPLVEGGQFIETGSLTAMQALPEAVTLRAFNCWEKNRYEAHEIKLK